jgi:hypothetical protein
MKNITIALLLLTSFLSAQNTTNVLGRVFDENEKPISGAKITISELSLEVITDGNGNFILENITPKTYNFTAAAVGFETETKFNIIIKSAGNSDLNFILKTISTNLQEVKITARQQRHCKSSSNASGCIWFGRWI